MVNRNLVEEEQHLLAVLSSNRFLRMEGLSNEVPFFIYPYAPEHALVIEKAKQRLFNQLYKSGIQVLEVDLYDLACELLEDSGDWAEIIEIESTLDKADFGEMLRSMLNPEHHLAPAIQQKLADSSFDIVFLTGIGEVFPYIRSHNVLNNLQSIVVNKPMLMFFPGRYEQSPSLGSSLVLFGRLKDDQYYRAKNILEQEP